MDIIFPSWEETRLMGGSRLFESVVERVVLSVPKYWFLWFWFTVLTSQREELIVWSLLIREDKKKRRNQSKSKDHPSTVQVPAVLPLEVNCAFF
jgi:hypothetical protein